ncbi:molybdate ABC transporter substrate-binding protein [Pontibaca methylaminivorans]|uniref:Molybdate transport system substrate-binding protein n=1 Tax=Pontibaca methylaminivorans TaxID=515897 RepID=A0A1R3WD11_9RHOB|nr:molybdate ABC transporter substrate-binding protein [Pontibaca methylaminivorans]SIT75761.1 molybdate transport system substrate-binding protein [Pontibaca methylaminivorans]
MRNASAALALLIGIGGGLPAAAEEVVVFAAASLKTALDEIVTDFEAKTGDRVLVSYAGSNALARQILGGAPADIFISASQEWMDEVEKGGEVAGDSRVDLLGNTLVLVAHDDDVAPLTLDADTDLAGLIGDEKLAMALVDSVPAGQYGRQALTSLGLWDEVEGSVAQADNVRATLALVAMGEAPFGIVYATDAAAEPAVHVIGTFPADSHDPVSYPAALLKAAGDGADDTFFNALRDPDATRIFAEHGFETLN